MTKCSKKVSIKWTSHLTQGWTSICGAQQEEAKNTIFEYIEVFYNRVRMHSSNDYLSPVQYEEIQKCA
jgi:hypothetical protein